MKKIAFEDIKKSYNGKPGCMCGCNGNYAIASHYGIEAANKDSGWDAHDKCSDRSVKIAVNKINKAIEAAEGGLYDDHHNTYVFEDGTELEYSPDHYISLENGTRVTVVYLK